MRHIPFNIQMWLADSKIVDQQAGNWKALELTGDDIFFVLIVSVGCYVRIFSKQLMSGLLCSQLQRSNCYAMMDDVVFVTNSFVSHSDIPAARHHPVNVKVCAFT